MADFPEVRLRRFRRSPSLRALVRETRLSLDQFVMPLFVALESLANERLPGMARYSVDDVVREVEDLVRTCTLTVAGRLIARLPWPASTFRWSVPAGLGPRARITVVAVDRAGNRAVATSRTFAVS